MSDILFEQRGCIGLVTLNRARALNALTHEMVVALSGQLDIWQNDDAVKAIVVVSASDRAFSAGGDIRKVWEGRDNPPFVFFFDEYRLNRKIFRYPKPYISLIDGIVMGGGVGISVHGKYRIATENIRFAMPEGGIGFFPDVGGSYFLPRMKGQTGTYCALTGARLKQGDCLAFGIATHAVASEDLGPILERLIAGDDIETVLEACHRTPPSETSAADQALVDRVFGLDSVPAIIKALDTIEGEFASRIRDQLGASSPTSVRLAFEQVRRGANLDFEACMIMEYRMVRRILCNDDFYEGVRATLIDKDGAPKWNPETINSVDPAEIEAHFAPLGDNELTFDAQ